MTTLYELTEPHGESGGTISVLPLGPSEPVGAGLRAVRAGLVRQIGLYEQITVVAQELGMVDLQADICASVENMISWIVEIDRVLLADGQPEGAA